MEANLDNPGFSGLATDLYQLTMAAAYHANGRNELASFELFTRRLPERRSYLIVAGLEQALDYLRGLSFSSVSSQTRFSGAFGTTRCFSMTSAQRRGL